MRGRKLIIALALLPALSAGCSTGADPGGGGDAITAPGTVTAVVVDADGLPVAGTVINKFQAASAAAELCVTGEDGTCTFTMAPGEYELTAAYEEVAPEARTVAVASGRTVTVEFDIALIID